MHSPARTAAVLLLALTPHGGFRAATRFLEVTATDTPIRYTKSERGEIVAQAARGDCFEYEGLDHGWHAIYLPSGELRYVARAGGTVTASCRAPVPSAAALHAAGKAAEAAESRAMREATARYRPNTDREIDYERMLTDRYELAILRRYGVAPAYWSKVLVTP